MSEYLYIKIVFSTSCPVGMTRETVASSHYKVYIKAEEYKKRQDIWNSSTSNKDIGKN